MHVRRTGLLSSFTQELYSCGIIPDDDDDDDNDIFAHFPPNPLTILSLLWVSFEL